MLSLLARLVIAAPKRVLAVVLLITVIAAGFGATVAEHLGAAGFQDPSSPSARGMKVLTSKFGQGDMDLTFVVSAPGSVQDPSAAAAGRKLVQELRRSEFVNDVESPWDGSPHSAGLISKDGKTGLVVTGISGSENDAPKHAKAIAEKFTGMRDGVQVLAGGTATVASEINDQSEKDLVTAEAITLPLSLIVLVWVFGGLFAALLPLVVGGLAIVGTLGMLRGITLFADVSIFSLDLTTAMGLALAIDYTLLLISRYREEYVEVGDRDVALRRAVATAGRTILFSACTVFLAVSALAVFPMYFLRSMAYAGCGVVALAGLYAVVVAPAVIKLLGDRIEALNIRALFRRSRPDPDVRHGALYRVATFVTRHALPCALAVVALLLLLGSPFARARFGLPDDRVLPTTAQSRQAGDIVRRDFPADPSAATSIVIPDAGDLTIGDVSDYATALSNVPGVEAVSAPNGSYVKGDNVGPPMSAAAVKDGSLWLTVSVPGSSLDSRYRAAVDQLRAVPVPHRAEALFTGAEQLNRDSVDEIVRRLPVVLLLVAATTFVLIFLLTGSLVLPLEALVLNTLSLSATLGALVFVFQEGHLGGLGTTATGTLVADVLVFLFATAFGLSMDYEVFLLSRIREHWLKSEQRQEDNVEAVTMGIATAGRVITAAALLMVIVFAALSTGEVSFMRMIGVGLALAVIVDATLVRMVLVPAFMKLVGRWNWWAPRPLAKLHAAVGISES
ncbi:MMPL family transporter [Candidatus Mycobacterium wuenschmannii]|uniref:MMPL family transporter n=1 Tax=Candidatus Mycobacterium wuenschmannii TaxID=3027808 RepID=A0ABY8VWD1_9MYCO|nr:MMPL family transporter [Candidatus Mycobacterium wuenschmannii]WIM87616.1 MMPL family transporter [Candidatus Mycobacterium wuenschmannii]